MNKKSNEPPCTEKTLPPLGFVLHRANRAFTRMLDAELRHLGITSAQLGPLILIAQNGHPMLQRDLVKQSAIAQPAMVSAINLLTRNGFIEQRSHGTDRRATLLYLTADGRAVVEQAEPILARCNKRALFGLSEEQERELIGLTATIIANIERNSTP